MQNFINTHLETCQRICSTHDILNIMINAEMMSSHILHIIQDNNIINEKSLRPKYLLCIIEKSKLQNETMAVMKN